jgi:hypothetical protein
MQSFFWQVLADSRVYATLSAEIEAAAANGTIPPTGNISWAESQQLPYFQACLKEAMRTRPAVGLNITRLVPPEGVELDGQFLKGGTRVALNGWVLHLDKPTFGEDSDVYRPERWLGDAENAKRMERYMFQVRTPQTQRIGRLIKNDHVNQLSCSLAVAVMSVSVEIWLCWRSTRSCRDSCGTTSSSWSTRVVPSKQTQVSSSFRKALMFISRRERYDCCFPRNHRECRCHHLSD